LLGLHHARFLRQYIRGRKTFINKAQWTTSETINAMIIAIRVTSACTLGLWAFANRFADRHLSVFVIEGT
jgi:hypothetical protein